MAHRLSSNSGKAEFAYVGETPWHGLGEQVSEHMTPADAVARVLPWTVSTRPIAYPTIEGGAFDRDGGAVRVIARDDSHTMLGVATKTYQPIQNAQAGDVADALIAEGAKCVETIGALDDGARCFMLLTLDKSGFEVKAGDTVLPYFLLRWGHDGQTTLAGKLTAIRVVCHNTLTAAGKAYSFDVRHTASAKLRIDDAREAMGLARKAYVVARDEYRTLAARSITRGQAVEYFGTVFPIPNVIDVSEEGDERLARWNAVQTRLLDMFQGAGKGADMAGTTAWGAYNAVTEYLDHVYPATVAGKVSATRQQSVLFGSYATVRDFGYRAALALAN